MVGPLRPGKGGVKFVVMVVDYFTRWVKAEALVTVTTNDITRFLWRNIVCRFGISCNIMSNNGR